MSLDDKVVVFTGRLQSMTRAEASRLAEAAGATVRTNVSAHTDVLVVGQDAGAKLDRAPADAEQLSEAEFLEIVGAGAGVEAEPEPEQEHEHEHADEPETEKPKKKKSNKTKKTKKTKKGSSKEKPDRRAGKKYSVHLELVNPAKGHNKYYVLEVRGKSLFRHWGRYGSKGQTKLEDLDSVAEARKQFDKLYEQKTRKGYVPAPEESKSKAPPRSSKNKKKTKTTKRTKKANK
jgi:predicted DNA-binding WGR domain protein